MPYKRKKWSPFTSNEYTEEELDQIAEAMAEKDSGERRRAEKSYQNMHDFGKSDEAYSDRGSVWQKRDDKKKKKNKLKQSSHPSFPKYNTTIPPVSLPSIQVIPTLKGKLEELPSGTIKRGKKKTK